jgi:uncharacterized membrane protein YkvA (DUF1232 family)
MVIPNRCRRRVGMLALLRRPRALWRFLRDRDAPFLPRLLAVLAIAYVLLPLDALPDVAPLIGWLDDLGVVGAVLAYVAARAARYESERPGSPGAPRLA